MMFIYSYLCLLSGCCFCVPAVCLREAEKLLRGWERERKPPPPPFHHFPRWKDENIGTKARSESKITFHFTAFPEIPSTEMDSQWKVPVWER